MFTVSGLPDTQTARGDRVPSQGRGHLQPCTSSCTKAGAPHCHSSLGKLLSPQHHGMHESLGGRWAAERATRLL